LPGNLPFAFSVLAATVRVVAPAAASAVSEVYSFTMVLAAVTVNAPLLPRWALSVPLKKKKKRNIDMPGDLFIAVYCPTK
jgi:hypothetical protein